MGIPGGGIPPGGGSLGGAPGGTPAGGRLYVCGGATEPGPCGVMIWADGPPTPRTGPVNPGGAATCVGGIGTPLPAARPIPGPAWGPPKAFAARALSLDGGGPSIVSDTRFIPLSSTRPSARFSSLSGCLVFFGFIFLNSSQSANTRFMCWSKARNVPMKMRPSSRMILIR